MLYKFHAYFATCKPVNYLVCDFAADPVIFINMWWKLVLLTIYLAVLFILSRILEAVTHYQGGYLPSRLLDPVSLSVRRLKALLDQRGVSYTGIVERHELTELVQQSGM